MKRKPRTNTTKYGKNGKKAAGKNAVQSDNGAVQAETAAVQADTAAVQSENWAVQAENWADTTAVLPEVVAV